MSDDSVSDAPWPTCRDERTSDGGVGESLGTDGSRMRSFKHAPASHGRAGRRKRDGRIGESSLATLRRVRTDRGGVSARHTRLRRPYRRSTWPGLGVQASRARCSAASPQGSVAGKHTENPPDLAQQYRHE